MAKISSFNSNTIDVDTLIIGAGPVGLMMAIKLRNSGHTVALIEKRFGFTRKQIIIIDEVFYKALPKNVEKALFGSDTHGCYVLPPPQDWDGICYLNRSDFDILPFASIRIDLLQYELLKED